MDGKKADDQKAKKSTVFFEEMATKPSNPKNMFVNIPEEGGVIIPEFHGPLGLAEIETFLEEDRR